MEDNGTAPRRRYRKIGTEEAFMVEEQRAAIHELMESGYDDPDLIMWRSILVERGPERRDRLMDIGEGRLAMMDEHDVDMHLLSLTSPGVQMFETNRAVGIARVANDKLAEAVARHPSRYAGLATVAPQDPEEAAREIERAIKKLKLNGIVINSHTNGEYLDQEKFWPILEAAEACDAPIYIHPRTLPAESVRPFQDYTLETAMWGFQAETGLHGVRLICSGVLERFPNLKLVLGHMGEGIPYWLWRLDFMHGNGRKRPKLPMKPSEYFKRNFYITTSGMHWEPALKFCMETVGVERILFAVDYPYQPHDLAVEFMEEADITDEERALIYSGNSERIFNIAPADA